MSVFTTLTTAQQYALLDVVARGGLDRTRPGYDGTIIHQHRTMLALARRGLVDRLPLAAGAGLVVATAAGRRCCGGKAAAYRMLVEYRDRSRP